MSDKGNIEAYPGATSINISEYGDIGAYPDAVNDPQHETMKERSMRVLSRTRSATSWKDPGPPPDGGVFAWTQVLAGHLTIMNTWQVSMLSYA